MFGPPAWAPVLNNVVVIATGLLFIALTRARRRSSRRRITAGQVWLLGIGTTLGIVVQALVLLPLLRRAGVPLRPGWGLRAPGCGEAGPLGLWVIGYVVVSQVGVLVASSGWPTPRAGRAARALAAFANASLLFQMPYGIIGVALLTALLPRMSRAAARRRRGRRASPTSRSAPGCRRSALLPVTAAAHRARPGVGIVAFGRGNTDAAQARGDRRRRWPSARSGCCRSRSRCCSCGCSTR